jgi:hypothetical protein
MCWDLKLYPHKTQMVQMLSTANKQQRCEFCYDFLQFVQQYPATFACGLVMKTSPTLMGS